MNFDQLFKGVREMKRHMAGKSVRGTRTSARIWARGRSNARSMSR